MKKGNPIAFIIPIIVIALSLGTIGYFVFRYVTTPEEVVYSYINTEETEVATEEVSSDATTLSSGTRYILETSSPLEQEDIKKTAGESSETGDLEKLVEDINRQTEEQDVGEP